MDCGVPFCHQGCPLANTIPDWNDLVRTGRWEEAAARLHATDNFPDFTGRLCPAPCEAACVLSIQSLDQAVSIRQVELAISEEAWTKGWVPPVAPLPPTGYSIAIVGSGPAGLAAAQQLTRRGHAVTVYERSDRLGGLLRYGIPEFKMEKAVLERRLDQMRAEGCHFVTGADVGGALPVADLREEHDAVVLALGAMQPRDLEVPGRDLIGVHLAMEYLEDSNRVCEGDRAEPLISAEGRDVVIIGGGDTGADCLGTATRQGARSIRQLQYRPRPPEPADRETPWPLWPHVLHTCAAYEENGERLFSENTEELIGDSSGRLRALRTANGEMPCELALIAIGFRGVEPAGPVAELELELSHDGTVAVDADGRACAASVDDDLRRRAPDASRQPVGRTSRG
jgi:glutamate synthase (NADPH/NADH) small chain